jgi:hypothetical protein
MLVAVAALALGAQAEAQDRAGVVTTLEGHVTVTRAPLREPAPLKFKDDIFARDRIATGGDAVARILLGGRAVVTVRERSVVTITEAPGVATVDVAGGRVAVAVAREKMRRGDVIQVRTPNAVAGIRGTVIVAEVFGADHSVVTVLKGTIDVTRLEAGRLVGAATIVDALHRVTIAGGAPIPAPLRVPPGAARRLGEEFRVAPPRTAPAAAATALTADEVARTARDFPRLTSDRDRRENVGRRDADGARRVRGAAPETTGYGNGDRDANAVKALMDALRHGERSGRGHRGRDRDRD